MLSLRLISEVAIRTRRTEGDAGLDLLAHQLAHIGGKVCVKVQLVQRDLIE